MSGNVAVIGEPRDRRDGCESGSAYVYEHLDSEWVRRAKLVADDASCLDGFGQSVAIFGDTVIIAAVGDDDKGNLSGSAYIFTRIGTEWVQQAKLVPSDGGPDESFGYSVEIFRNRVVVGAFRDDDNGLWSGSAYIFRRVGSLWEEETKLLPNDGQPRSHFGTTVSVSGDTVIVGAPGHDDHSGAAYVFVHSDNAWTQQARLHPRARTDQAEFGRSVTVEGSTAIVSAYGDNEGRGTGAYIFARIGETWVEENKLLPDEASGDEPGRFGHSVALSGDGGMAIVGTVPPHAVRGSGSAYIFQRTGMVWTQRDRLVSNNVGGNFDMFGWSVSVDDNVVFVGSHGDDEKGDWSGSAHAFELC